MSGRITVLASRAKSPVWVNQGIAVRGYENEEFTVGEPNIIYEDNPQILADPYVFKMWFTAGNLTPMICYAESADGLDWTLYAGNPIINNYKRSSIRKHGGVYYKYSSTGSSMFTSLDGINWTLQGSGLIPGGGAGAWDENGPANSYMWVEDGLWYMMYDSSGPATPDTYQLGLATSPDALVWTKYAGNPVITGPPAQGGPWVIKIGLKYYCWSHGGYDVKAPTDIMRYESTDLINWTRRPRGFTYYRTTLDEGIDTDGGQVADVDLVEVGGKTYMYYAALRYSHLPVSFIKVAVADMPINVLIGTNERIFPHDGENELIWDGGFERFGHEILTGSLVWSTDTASDGSLDRATVAGEFRSGRAAIKITAGPNRNTYTGQTRQLTPGVSYTVTGWARGDGVNAPRAGVYSTWDGWLVPTHEVATSDTNYQSFSMTFDAPSGHNTHLRLNCPDANGGVAYFDDISWKPT